MSIAATWEEQVDFVRGMSPAAAKILWILLLSGRSLTGKELEFACNLTDKPIKQGLDWLEFKGLVQNNGKFNGWSLSAAAMHLPIPQLQLDGESRNISDIEHLESRKFSDIRRIESRNISDDRKYSDHDPSSSSSSIQTNTNLAGNTGEEEEERRNGESRKFSDFLPDPDLETMRECLVAAGVARRSRKLAELLGMGLELDFVKAHIAAREAILANDEPYPVRNLITKLIDGDPVPQPERPKSHIPPELEGIIRR